jgi:glyoxylase-like metal-dependent hydrolase (beta-lactamase superfamily II)
MPHIETIDLKFQGLEKAIACFLIETSEGPILIETGPYSTFPVLKKELLTKGIKTSDVKNVFLTHIHLDHAGAAWAFAKAGAKIYLHPFGAKNMEDPSRLMASAKMIYQDRMDELWGEMNPIPGYQLVQVEHHEVINIGDIEIKSLHTPGHAKHHIAWHIDNMIFAGDAAGIKIGSGSIQPPCPPPDINIEQWKASIDIIKNAGPDCLYLTHFDKIKNVNRHLDELSFMLDDWSNFIKEKMEEGFSNEEMVPLFVAYTNEQLAVAGLNESDIDTYQAANPSWMSVAGLVRYWTKKSQT